MNKRITATLSAVLILLVAGYRGSGRYTPPTTGPGSGPYGGGGISQGSSAR